MTCYDVLPFRIQSSINGRQVMVCGDLRAMRGVVSRHVGYSGGSCGAVAHIPRVSAGCTYRSGPVSTTVHILLRHGSKRTCFTQRRLQ